MTVRKKNNVAILGSCLVLLTTATSANERIWTPREIDEFMEMFNDEDNFHIAKAPIKNKQEYLECIAMSVKLDAPKTSEPVIDILKRAVPKCIHLADYGYNIGSKSYDQFDLYTHEFTACMKYEYSLCPDNCAEYFGIPKTYMTQLKFSLLV